MKNKLLISFFMLLMATMAWAEVMIDKKNFPDENFRIWVFSQEYGQDGVLTDEEIAGTKSININKKGIKSLRGIEYFTALTELDCAGNQLDALDVSKNTALTKLDCGGNPLMALDVSENTALTELVCYKNQLTILDVSQNTALTNLRCYDNQLTALDVSNNTALTLHYLPMNSSWQEYEGTSDKKKRRKTTK